MEMEKPEFLKTGDKLHLKVDGLGEQFHEIIDEELCQKDIRVKAKKIETV